MKTEREFLDGVYEKYEKELDNRRKRVKALSVSATLSACACIVLVVAVRVFPEINNVAEDAAVAEASYKYSLYSSSVEPDQEIVAEMSKSYNAAVKSQSIFDITADVADDAIAITESAEAPEAEEIVEETVEDNDTGYGAQYSNAGNFIFNLYTSNSCVVYEDKIEYTDINGNHIATAYTGDISAFTCTGCTYPQIAEADGGYYINHKSNGENIVIFLNGEKYEEKLAQSVADSIVYKEN